MKLFHDYMYEYKKQIEKGDIKEAYRGLMEYIMNLRNHFKNKYKDFFVSSNIYFGYMDMTYFSFTPKSLKQKKLKIAIVFNHEKFRFEVWLGGYNKQIQLKYWNLFKKREWKKYQIPSTIKNEDSIIEYYLVDNPDFSNLNNLTDQIEKGTLKFINEIKNYLS